MDDAMTRRPDWNSRPWRLAAWAGAAALMMVPVSVQLYSGYFGWSPADFIVAALVLFGAGALFDFAARRAPTFSYLAGAGAALAAGFGMFVVNGAVGLVGGEDQPANLLFGLVILVAILGSVAARGRPERLAATMFLAALAQVAVSIAVIFMVGLASDSEAPFAEIVGLSMFAALWAGSGWLFRISAR